MLFFFTTFIRASIAESKKTINALNVYYNKLHLPILCAYCSSGGDVLFFKNNFSYDTFQHIFHEMTRTLIYEIFIIRK